MHFILLEYMRDRRRTQGQNQEYLKREIRYELMKRYKNEEVGCHDVGSIEMCTRL